MVLPRNQSGLGSEVMGDPCIVWDEEINNWRMIHFCAPPGHGQSVHRGDINDIGPGTWHFEGPLTFTNPQALPDGTHKPFVVLDPYKPNQAAKIEGKYSLVTVSWTNSHHKVVQQAWATSLAGPWTLEEGLVIPGGNEEEFDGNHVDAVSAYYFPERKEFLYFYMGYPLKAQPRDNSPFGSAQGVAVRRLGESGKARKLGIILAPSEPGHWAGGYVGGLQLLPGKRHRWIAVVNASPTAPYPEDPNIWREEPPPSLGGFAYCDEEWPVSNWHWFPEPFETIEDLPAQAIASGEGVNFWRHYLLILPDNQAGLFYNSGTYGKEQMYLKITNLDTLSIL